MEVKKLVCDVCGGQIEMQSGGKGVCTSCGTPYSAEIIKDKIQEIRGTIKVDGPVETIKGDAEKERLINIAETHFELNDFLKCLQTYKILIEQYPNNYRVWVGFAKASLVNADDVSFVNIDNIFEKNISIALKFGADEDVYKAYVHAYEQIISKLKINAIYLSLNGIEKLLKYNYRFQNHEFINFLNDYYKKCCNNATLVKNSITHAANINVRSIASTYEDFYMLYGKIKDIIAISDYDVLTATTSEKCIYTNSRWSSYGKLHCNLQESIKRLQTIDQKLIWRDNKLCTYCGGNFSFWTGKCKKCGKDFEKFLNAYTD